MHWAFSASKQGGTPTTEIQEILSPLSVFSLKTRGGLQLLKSGNPFSMFSFFSTQGGLPLLRSRKPLFNFQFFLQTRGDSNYWDPEILSPCSVFPPHKGASHYSDPGNPFSTFSFFSKQGGTPTTEIRNSLLHFQLFLQTREGLQLLRSGNPFSMFSFFSKQGRGLQLLRSGNPFSIFSLFSKQGRDSNYWDPKILFS